MNRINMLSQKEKEESVLRRDGEGEGELSYAAVVGSISLKAPEASSNPGKIAGRRTCRRVVRADIPDRQESMYWIHEKIWSRRGWPWKKENRVESPSGFPVVRACRYTLNKSSIQSFC